MSLLFNLLNHQYTDIIIEGTLLKRRRRTSIKGFSIMSYCVITLFLLLAAITADVHSLQGPLPIPEKSNSCPSMYDAIGDQCIYFDLISSSSHHGAVQSCQSFGGELVAIRTATQLENIIKHIHDKGFQDLSFWIDGSDAEEEGNWVYSTGESFVKGTPFWLSSETYTMPDDLGGDQDCAHIAPEYSYFIDDESCESSYYPICEHELVGHKTEKVSKMMGKDAGPSASSIECPSFFVDVSGTCFAFLTWQQVTWHQAHGSCIGISGEVASLTNIEELKALYNYLHVEGLSGHSFWLGGSDTQEEGSWIWTDGNPVPMGSPWWGMSSNYTQNWEPEPEGDINENCLSMTSAGSFYLRDKDCDFLMTPLCRLLN